MNHIKKFLSQNLIFVTIGLINIILFHYAIYRLFVFLYDSSHRLTDVRFEYGLIINSFLIAFFSVPHSLLLKSKIKTKILNYIPKALYSTIYSLHSCLAIVLMDHYWVDFNQTFYQITGNYKLIFNTLYVLSWLFMSWAMLSNGLFRQSGIEEWFHTLRNKKIKYSPLAQKGAYRVCRHPIYAAFIAMIWTTPNMSYDHLFLTLGWTFYIIWGAGQKEKRLMKNHNYKSYAKNVTAFPFIGKIGDNFFTHFLWRI